MKPMERICIARLRPDARIPTRKHPADAGLDLYAVEAVTLAPHSVGIVPTGITLEIPAGVVALIKTQGAQQSPPGSRGGGRRLPG